MALKSSIQSIHGSPADTVAGASSAAPRGRRRVGSPQFEKAPVPTWLVTAPGLWAPRRRGQAGDERIELGDVRVFFRDGEASFAGCELKGLRHLRSQDFQVLMALCQLAAMVSKRSVLDQDDEQEYLQARQCLCLAPDVLANWQIAAGELNYLALLSSLGLTDTGGNRQRLREALRRLSSVQFAASFDGKPVSIGLIHADCSMASTVQVHLSFLLLFPSYFQKGVAWIDLAEQRQLKSEPARRLHAWLSWWCSGKDKQRIRFGKLVSHVWGDDGETQEAVRYRRKCLGKALDEIAMLPGWHVEEDPSGMLTMAMPRFSPQDRKVGPG